MNRSAAPSSAREHVRALLSNAITWHASRAVVFRAGPVLLRVVSLIGVLVTGVAADAGILTVPAGGDLQSAINAAQPGDTIVLETGASYVGSFWLPNKAGDAYITIRTSTPDSGLPPGTRVNPADAWKMAKIVTPGRGLPAISTEAGAHHYRLIGLEIMPADPSSLVYEVVSLGTSGPEQSTLDSVPHHITIDRCFIHGWPNANFKRGIGLNSAHTDILDSHVSDFHSDFQDSQAIGGFNGPGPFRIINNRLEAAAENIMFGGATPSIYGLVPSNIEIRRNHLYKPMSWKPGEPGSTSYRPWIKNLFEVKNGQDIVVDGNIMENNWHQADQHGTAIVLSPRSEDGTAPWAVVQRITFTNNHILNVGGGVAISHRDDGVPNWMASNAITFRNNLLENIRNDFSYDSSRVIQVNGTSQVTFDHNTVLHANNLARAYGEPTRGFTYTNNITNYGGTTSAGLWTDCGMDQAGLGCHFPGSTFLNNVVIGAPSGAFGSSNWYPVSASAVGFVDYASGNFRLGPASPYRNAGTDGKDIGADVDAIRAAYNGASAPPPPPPPTPNAAPTVSLTAPAATDRLTAPATITIGASASDIDGTVTSVEFFQGSTRLGEGAADGSGRYTFVWSGVPAGTYNLTGRATDDDGAVTTSNMVVVTVDAPTNAPPTVSITGPANGASYTAPAQIVINANAADADGSISVVEFFQGATKLGEDRTSPYSFVWSGVAAGTYAFTARATDNTGATSTSALVTITVAPAPTGDFTLSASPVSRSVRRGGSTLYTIAITRVGGFTGPLTFSVSSVLPDGVSVTFGRVLSSGVRFTVRTSSSTPVGTHTITIAGTSASLQHWVPVSLKVRK